MGRDDWWRNTSWNEDIEAAFFNKLRGPGTNRSTCAVKLDFLRRIIPRSLCGYWINILPWAATYNKMRRTSIERALILPFAAWMLPSSPSRPCLPGRTPFRIFEPGPFTNCRFSSKLSA